jgi:hypothetical protein
MTLRVFNNGVKVAEERVNGDEKLRGSFWNPIGASERVAVAKQKEKLDQLFGSSRVRAALDGGSSVQPAQFDQRPTLVSTQPKASEVSEVKVSPTHEQRAGTRLEACSIEQVLSMKGSGLSDSQIKAACAETGK